MQSVCQELGKIDEGPRTTMNQNWEEPGGILVFGEVAEEQWTFVVLLPCRGGEGMDDDKAGTPMQVDYVSLGVDGDSSRAGAVDRALGSDDAGILSGSVCAAGGGREGAEAELTPMFRAMRQVVRSGSG